MSIFRRNKTWLYYQAKTEVRSRHKNLFDVSNDVKDYLINAISSKNSWWLIFIIVVLFFGLSVTVNLDFLNFISIDIKTVSSIVDQRTANIAGIISISLVVVGFLINNLAVKTPTTFALLFKKSLLYLTIYLTLSTIFCFIVLSTLRETISEFYFIRMVLAGTYLSLIIIVLIGFLFRRIILFSNEKEIDRLLEIELIKNAKSELKHNLIKITSSKLYEQNMELFCIEHSYNTTLIPISDLDFYSSLSLKKSNKNKEKYVIDLNFFLLNLFLYKNCDKLESYSKISLYEKYSLELETFYKLKSNQTISWIFRVVLWRLIFKKSKTVFRKENIYLEDVKIKVMKSAKNGNHNELSNSLTTLLELYKLQIQVEKEYEEK